MTPATLAVIGVLLKSPALLPYAFVWINHIGVDRLLGYGLKYPRALAGRTWDGWDAPRTQRLLRSDRLLVVSQHEGAPDEADAKMTIIAFTMSQ